MKTILLTNKYTGTPLSIVRQEVPEEFELRFLSGQTQDALLEEVCCADYILAGGRLRITEEVLERAVKLRMIQRSGVGLDTLDLKAIRERRIPLYVNQGVNAESVAEHALLLILACLRRLPSLSRNTKNGIWKKQEQGVQTAELRGKTVGIIGMGNIAKTLVGLLQPFRVRILYHDLHKLPPEYETGHGMTFVSLDRLLTDSDIVTIHCALTDETRGMINAESIRKMKAGAVLINTARGEIIDPAALADGLKNGPLSYAALDVHVQEPVPEDYPLKELDNVILTPHVAGITADSFRAMMRDAFRNIECFEKGKLEEIASHRLL